MEILKVDLPPKPIEKFANWYERHHEGKPLPIYDNKYIVLEDSDIYMLAYEMQKEPGLVSLIKSVREDYEFKTRYAFEHEVKLTNLVEARRYCEFQDSSLDQLQDKSIGLSNQPFYRRFEGRRRKYKGYGRQRKK